MKLTHIELSQLINNGLPKKFDDLKLGSYTEIESDAQTLLALAKYTSEACQQGHCILDLSSLTKISPAVLMVLLREEHISYILLSSLKTFDVGCAKIFVQAMKDGTDWIHFGANLDLSQLPSDVIATLFTWPWYAFTEENGNLLLDLRSEETYNEVYGDTLL